MIRVVYWVPIEALASSITSEGLKRKAETGRSFEISEVEAVLNDGKGVSETHTSMSFGTVAIIYLPATMQKLVKIQKFEVLFFGDAVSVET